MSPQETFDRNWRKIATTPIDDSRSTEAARKKSSRSTPARFPEKTIERKTTLRCFSVSVVKGRCGFRKSNAQYGGPRVGNRNLFTFLQRAGRCRRWVVRRRPPSGVPKGRATSRCRRAIGSVARSARPVLRSVVWIRRRLLPCQNVVLNPPTIASRHLDPPRWLQSRRPSSKVCETRNRICPEI